MSSPSNTGTSPYNPQPGSSNRSKIILVTGINGYIASHIAHLLLSLDYTVRGTSRHADTLERMTSQPAFAAYKATTTNSDGTNSSSNSSNSSKSDSNSNSITDNNNHQLQHVLIPDMTVPSAFDAAVHDVHAIIHVASPIDFAQTRSTDAFIVPATRGVTSLLTSAVHENLHRNGSIASFVLTSSVAAVVDRWVHPAPAEGGGSVYRYTERDWNESSERVARESEGTGRFAAMVAYGASKARAERAMWEFTEAARSQAQSQSPAGFACTSINPAVVTGPPVLWPQHPTQLNETLKPIWSIYSGLAKRDGVLPPQIGGAGYIDVRDVALVHVWAALNPRRAGGERYLVCNGKAPPQAIADVVRRVYGGEEGVRNRVFEGMPGKGYTADYGFPGDENQVGSEKILAELGGRRFRGFEESLVDTLEGFRGRWEGLVEKSV